MQSFVLGWLVYTWEHRSRYNRYDTFYPPTSGYGLGPSGLAPMTVAIYAGFALKGRTQLFGTKAMSGMRTLHGLSVSDFLCAAIHLPTPESKWRGQRLFEVCLGLSCRLTHYMLPEIGDHEWVDPSLSIRSDWSSLLYLRGSVK